MIKAFSWKQTYDLRDGDEKAGFLKSLRNDTLDMEIDLSRIDSREKEKVNCYRSYFHISEAELETLGNYVILDFPDNSYIARYLLYINGTQAGYAYCAGYEQKYTVSKDIFHVGENDICIVVEYAAGMRLWKNGTSQMVYPKGYTTELAALPREMMVYNLRPPCAATGVTETTNGVFISLSDGSTLAITLYENGVYRFKCPCDFENIMDEMCTEQLSDNLKAVSPDAVETSDTCTTITTEKGKIRVFFSPFSIEIENENGITLYKGSGILHAENGVSLMEVALSESEHIFGLGESTYPHIDKRGQLEDIWLLHHYEKCDIPCPYYISTNGYGLYLNTAYHSVFDMGKTFRDKALIYVYDTNVDFFFMQGRETQDIVSSYAKITGIAPLPPKWAFGFWQAGFSVQTQEGAEEIVDNYNKYDIPLDVMCIDPGWQKGSHCDLEWSKETFPDKEGFIKKLQDNEVNLILWSVPFINDQAESYDYHIANKTGLLTADGESFPVTYWKGSDAVALDFANETAVSWLSSKVKALIDGGVSGMKIDGGDSAEIPVTVHSLNGLNGRQLHNLYPLYYAKTMQSILETHIPGKRPITWQRTGYVGSGKYPCSWGGDQLAEFKHLQVLLKAGQACGLMNVPFWSQDIGGFCLTPNTDEEFFIRSYEWGCLSPLSRAHGGKTEPWAYGERALDIAGKYIRLRYLLLPYIYSGAYEAHLHQKPIMVPLFYYHLKDERTYSRDFQYYLGRNLMLAPAYKAGGKEDLSCDIDIYFPEGRWLDFDSGEVFEGGMKIDRNVKIDELPIFVKIGSVIPFAKEVTNVKHYHPEELCIRFYPAEEAGSFDFYDDEGEDLSYKNGAYNCIRFSCRKCGKDIALTVETIHAGYNKDYCGNYDFIVFCEEKPESITVNGAPQAFVYDEAKQEAALSVTYHI